MDSITIDRPKILADCWIGPNCQSQVFQLDACRLLTILNPLNMSTGTGGSSATNLNAIQPDDCVKIVTNNGKLMLKRKSGVDLNNNNNNNNKDNKCDQHAKVPIKDCWLYHVRLASNCFEQNLVAYPAQQSSHIDQNHNHETDRSSNDCRTTNGLTHQPQPWTISWPVFYLVTRPIEPGEELCFWPWFGLSLSLGIPPFLSLANILNDHCYVCHQCGNCFTQPNPLKIHLVLACSKRNVGGTSLTVSSSSPSSSSSMYSAFASINRNVSSGANRTTRATICDEQYDQLSVQSGDKGGHTKVATSLPKRLHTCSYCGKVYTRKYGLKIHIRTHTGLKPLNCRYCGRSFSDPSNLNKHMRLHNQHLAALMVTRGDKTTTQIQIQNSRRSAKDDNNDHFRQSRRC